MNEGAADRGRWGMLGIGTAIGASLPGYADIYPNNMLFRSADPIQPLAITLFTICSLVSAFGQTPVFPPDFGKPKLAVNAILLPEGTNQPPSQVRVTFPSAPTGGPRASTLTAQVFDPNGWNDIRNLYLIISDQLNSRNACFLHVDAAARTLRLANDNADAWTSLPQPAGTPVIASNSRCSAHIGGASINTDLFFSAANATPLTVKIPISFTETAPARLNIYAFADDLSGAILQWSQVGTLVLAPIEAPTVRPSSSILTPIGGPSLMRFNAVVTDRNGTLDVTKLSILANDTLSAGGGCLIEIDLRKRTVRLANDAATDWLQPAGVISSNTGNSRQYQVNSSCGFDAGDFSIMGLAPNEASELRISGNIELRSFTQGAKFLYANAEDAAGLSSGWTYIGKVNASIPAAAGNPDPNAGKYPPVTSNQFMQQAFTRDPLDVYVSAADNDGVGDISVVYLLVNDSITTANGCLVEYDPGRGLMRLAQDSGTGWLPQTLAPGAPGVLANSQCEIIGAESVASLSSSSRMANLTVKIRRKATFTGAKKLYSFAVDKTGRTSGWDTLGEWVPEVFRDYINILSVNSRIRSEGFVPYMAYPVGFSLEDPEGLANISTAYALFSNSTLQGTNACLVEFRRVGQQFQLTLANDAGLFSGQASLLPEASGTLSNSQCTISAYMVDGNFAKPTFLPINFFVAFKPQLPTSPFSGRIQLSGRVLRTNGFDLGWRPWASYNHPATLDPKPFPVQVSTPQSSASLFSFGVSALRVFDPEATQELLFTRGEPTLAGSCWMKFSFASRLWQLNSESGDALQAGSSATTGALTNSRCRLQLGRSVADSTSNTTAFYAEFLPAFSGQLHMYTRGTNVLGQSSGWVFAGTFVAPPASGISVALPLLIRNGQEFVAAKSGTGIEFPSLQPKFQDLSGAQNLSNGYVLVNSSLSAQNGCFVWLDLRRGVARLARDSGQEWLPGTLAAESPSGTPPLENTYCRLVSWSQANASSTTVVATMHIQFKPAFVGNRRVYTNAENLQGQASGWEEKFEWVVPQLGAPRVLPVEDTPLSLNQREGEFGMILASTTLADTTASIKQMTLLVGNSLTDPGACRFRQTVTPSSVELLNETGAPVGRLTTASSADAEISYRGCTIFNQGTQREFQAASLQMNFRFSFRMQRPNREIFGVFAKADAENGSSSEWTQISTWTVPGRVAPSIQLRIPTTHLVAHPNAGEIAFEIDDANGTSDVTNIYLIIRTGSTTAGACFLGVDVKSGEVRLAADSGQAWLVPSGRLGTSSWPLRNSQCEIRKVNWGASGGRLGRTTGALWVDFLFTNALRGRRQLEAYVEDTAGLNSTWRSLASIDIP